MSFRRIIISFVMLTVIGLLFVHIQVRIVELGYEIREKEDLLVQLLDRNKILVYNINTLSSPLNLNEQVLVKRKDLSAVNSYRKVRLASIRKSVIASRESPIMSFISNLFTPKAQAEASVIKK